MSRLLILSNLTMGLFLFLVISGVAVSLNYFATSGAKLAAFIMGIVAMANAFYLAFRHG